MNRQMAGAVARGPESRALDDFLLRATTTPAGLVVGGEAGIGKTTFVLDARERAAAQGFHVLMTRGSPSEVTLSFAGLADLLSQVAGEIIDRLAPVQRDALNRILLRGADVPSPDERAAAAGLLSVLGHLSTEAPVLIVVDDVQWLDSASAAAVRFAVRRVWGPLGVLVTFRTGDPGARDAAQWFEMATPDAVARITMTPLSLGGVHALIASRLGQVLPRPTMHRIYEISGGNPLYALELARAAADGLPLDRQLPDSLAALVRHHVKDVSPDAAELLLAAACTPAPTVDIVARAAGLSPREVIDLLESGDAARAVVVSGQRIRFAHPLIATGCYTEADPARRREMHRRLAEVVDAPELKARHLACAATSGDAATLTELDTASAITRSQGAPAAAAELLELAIALGGDTPIRRLIAARYHFEAGSLAAARQHLKELGEELPAGIIRGSARMLQGAIDGYDGSFTVAVDGLLAGVDEVGEVADLRLQGLLLLAPGLGITGRAREALDCARAALVCAESIDDHTARSQAMSMWVLLSFMYGRGLDRSTLDEALRLQSRTDVMHVNMRADAVCALVDVWSGDIASGRRRLAAIKAECVEHGSELDAIWVDQHATMAAIWSADFEAAQRITTEMVHRADQMGGHHARLFALTSTAFVAAYTGDVDTARGAATSALELAERTGAVDLQVGPRTCLAFLDVSRADHQRALQILRPLVDTFDPALGTEIPRCGWIPEAIEALTATGNVDGAEVLVKALQDNGIRHNRAWMLAMAARGSALCLAARGDLEGAEAAAELALTHHDHLTMPFERARTQLLLGQLQRRRRRRQLASATLSDAERRFRELGAALWATRAKSERARHPGPEADDLGLTPVEARIARMAAAGYSNKEIAAQVFLSIKTIEMNLSSVYRKLGIRSRTQLHSRLDIDKSREIPDS
ncbi:helix-turn-helix transcriptional regulator [Mycolicibacterium parafortuitum]|uniref:LuxR family transcriptional regulator [Actinoplanes friuliensis DSM 7358] n=1 Tax=Mycolicibacterium parafortuitum TaxID=39692 RepID=A0A375YNQ9_MYCPF|nr:LuxR family transcriptional regulator [Mycolicibacterium parafortuitum]SRX82788.1 LuxR family transcriptional regulator [Actinoplanes friuliensis DSM 7358] [Mycolicibacterium parafortuitum]